MVLKEEGPTSDIYESTNDESPLISSSRSKTNRTLKIIIALLILLCVLCIISTITLAVMLVRHKHAETFHKKKRTIDVNNFIYFFQITDVHLDVLYSKYVSNENWQMCRNMSRRSGEPVNLTDGYAEFGRVGCDAPEALVKSAAKYMEEINGNLTKPIDFIIISGDQSAHGYHYFNVNPNETTLDSINTSMRIFGEAFPDVPIIPGLGNNDLFIDYLPPVANDSTLYMDIRQIIEPYLFLNSSNTKSIIEEFRGTFDVGGFYKYTLEGRHLVVLVLNTNYWSVNAYNKNSNVTVIGDIQIRWLNTELHAARQQSYKVIINGHIPPGCDSFDDKADWLQNYTNTYTFMVSAKYKDLIAAQLYGHHHKDKIHMLYTRDEYPLPDPQQYKTALLMSPSITPIYKNSPAFRLFAYNQKDGNLYNYTQYYMDLASSNVFSLPYWKKEYSFVELYNKTMTSLSLAVLTDEIADPASPTWPHYRSHIYSLNGGVLLSERFKEYCEAKHVSLDSYTKCIEHYKNYGEV